MTSSSHTDRSSKARSVHDRRPIRAAVFFTLLHYLCLLTTLVLLVLLLRDPKSVSITPVISAAVATLLTWIVSFVRRRSARCPLCKGSPLFDSRAVKHAKAYRLRPLNYGTTAVFGVLFTNRFRCMYCGTPYDMLKQSSTNHHQH